MSKKIVLALGGNALGDSLAEQMVAVQTTASAIVDLIEQGHQVIVTHGNGPQVGMINVAFEAASKTAATSHHHPQEPAERLRNHNTRKSDDDGVHEPH